MAKKTKKELDEITKAKEENTVTKPVENVKEVNVAGIKFTIK